MEFKDQYKSPLWQKKRLECLDIAEYTCQRCFDKESQLHVHHKRYVKGRMIWEYRHDELEVLCHSCHEFAHEEKEILQHILSQLPADGVSEITGLIAKFCNRVAGPSSIDLSEQIGKAGASFAVTCGAIAAKVMNSNSLSGAIEILELLDKAGCADPVSSFIPIEKKG